ncbi:MAG: helix-hairpin-helix domain-containing protein [Myxococcales bacterium]|nr:helix-hairpin-helix domain-containing protein [Myxococcota bacterium]MDW8281165.1 helix-hairpin-helix domain-containing protein [Myxococcales bacterium]
MALRPCGQAALALLGLPAAYLVVAPPLRPPALGPAAPAPSCPVPVLEPGVGLRCLEPTAAARLGPGDVSVTYGPPGRMAPARLLAVGVRIDVNRAPATELEALPGIGPHGARRLIGARPLRHRGDLVRVLGPRLSERIWPHVALGLGSDLSQL